MDSLQGNFLIATPRMPDPRFHQQVVYLCAHNEAEGAMGLIINQPTDHSLAEVMAGAGIELPPHPLPAIYLGGPVEMESGFFLFSADHGCPHYLEVTEQIRLSNDVEILRDIARGQAPVDYLFALGYSGWGPGQLAEEVTQGAWLLTAVDERWVFAANVETVWEQSLRQMGIDPVQLMHSGAVH